jgi:hypothetical protein
MPPEKFVHVGMRKFIGADQPQVLVRYAPALGVAEVIPELEAEYDVAQHGEPGGTALSLGT